MQRRRKKNKNSQDTGKKKRGWGCCWLAAEISNDLRQQKLPCLKGILFTTPPFISFYVSTISFLTLSKNLFLSHFPSNLLVPNFSATSWRKRVVTSAQAGNNTGTPSCGTKGNCLFALALAPKKLLLNLTALEHVPHGLHFTDEVNSLRSRNLLHQGTSSRRTFKAGSDHILLKGKSEAKKIFMTQIIMVWSLT